MLPGDLVMKRHLMILGTRGIPARHGGFETFAEGFALEMRRRQWNVTVYCQADSGSEITETDWHGIRCVHVPAHREGAFGTVLFDLRSVRHAAKQEGVVLTLGYNTAIFSVLHRWAGQVNVMNMDGIEWKRDKWNRLARAWLYCNEWLGARLANHLVADHPAIRHHLNRHTPSAKITVIPYGADAVSSAPTDPVEALGLVPGEYALVIARPEPENSILEIVRNYVSVKPHIPLVVLGAYTPERNAYHRQVMAAAGNSEQVRFVGPIYESTRVQALRFHARFYVHGHTIGGTNPSLVEAMATGRPVIAHDNLFNRWVLGEGGVFFSSEALLRAALRLGLEDRLQQSQGQQLADRHRRQFLPQRIYDAYEQVLVDAMPHESDLALGPLKHQLALGKLDESR